MLEKKLNEMNPTELQLADNMVQRTLDRLLAMYAGVSERGVKALFLLNGGGIVTILAYFDDTSAVKNVSLFSALVCFLLGLMLTVILIGLDYYVGMKSLNNFTSNIKKFNNGEINLSEAQNYANNGLTKLAKVTIPIAYIVSLLFIVGSFFGITGYLHTLRM